MIARFFLLVLILSFGELYLLVFVASKISFLTTFFLCFLTGVLGGTLVRQQGLHTIQKIQKNVSSMNLPAEDIVSGLILLVIGTLLLTPGFVTDVVGFMFLIPSLRRLAAKGLIRYFEGRIKGGMQVTHHRAAPASGPAQPTRDGNVIIDVEAKEVD